MNQKIRLQKCNQFETAQVANLECFFHTNLWLKTIKMLSI